MLPIIRIDQLAKELEVERRWVIEHWINRQEPDDPVGPAPHFRDGNHVFFDREELHEWAKRRSYGSDSTDIPTDP